MQFDLGTIATIGITVILTVILTLLTEYIINRIKENMRWKTQRLLGENTKVLNDALYPLQILQTGRFEEGSIDIHLLGKKERDEMVNRIIEKYKEKWWEKHGMYNNDIFSVSNISFFRKGREELPYLRIEGYFTKYYEFLATNANLNMLKDLSDEERMWLKKQTENSEPQVPVTSFANPLSVEVLLLCENGRRMVLPRRSSKTVFRGGKIGASVMETVSFLGEFDESTREINIFETIRRGLKEELGISPEYIDEIVITSLMFDWEVYDYKFTAFATTALSEGEIKARFNMARGKDTYENVTIGFSPFPPLILNIEELKINYTPEAMACIIFTLVEKKGWKSVERSLRQHKGST